jgi:hypothetical protein
MMSSRGMGDIAPSKMPKGKTAERKDGDKFTKYAKGGAVAKFQSGGTTQAKPKGNSAVALAREAEKKLRNYNDELMFMDRSQIPPPDVQQAQKAQLYKQMVDAAPLGFVPSQLPGNNYGFKRPEQWKNVEQLRKAGGLLTNPKTEMAEGGKVNAAGNYTKPDLRKRIVSQVKSAATQGTGAGQWSARKAQLVAKKYKAAGGGYRD